MDQSTRIVLLDNGSLKSDAVFSLRRISARLGERLDVEIHPVSLRHSNRIAAEELEGITANTWPDFLEREVKLGARRFVVLPLFFGESSAITAYLPEVTAKVLEGRSDVEVRVANPLVDLNSGDDRVARILSASIVEKLDTLEGDLKPVVILVDHGSPVKRVADARNLVAKQLKVLLGDRVSNVIAASMERREGAEYDFNEPLLATALGKLDADVALLSLMFFSPGRHAGPGGDIEKIVEKSGKALLVCNLVGESDGLIDLLAAIANKIIVSL